MKYRMLVVISDPKTEKGMNSDITLDLRCTFSYDPDTYGNGHSVKIEGGGVAFCNVYDLRYDKSFNKNQKMGWLEKWAHSYWSGEGGSYYVKSLSISKGEEEK